MLSVPRNLATHNVTRRAPVLKEVARNEVALAHHLQVAAHRDRIGADRADDKLIKVDYF